MRAEATNPFEDSTAVERYEAWYEGPGRRADRLEKALLTWLLSRFEDGRTLLDIGSGTGHFLQSEDVSCRLKACFAINGMLTKQ